MTGINRNFHVTFCRARRRARLFCLLVVGRATGAVCPPAAAASARVTCSYPDRINMRPCGSVSRPIATPVAREVDHPLARPPGVHGLTSWETGREFGRGVGERRKPSVIGAGAHGPGVIWREKKRRPWGNARGLLARLLPRARAPGWSPLPGPRLLSFHRLSRARAVAFALPCARAGTARHGEERHPVRAHMEALPALVLLPPSFSAARLVHPVAGLLSVFYQP
jgi:hypothetical protein